MCKVLKQTCFAFELFAMNATPGRRVTPPPLGTFAWQIVIPADRVTLPGRPDNPPRPAYMEVGDPR